MFSNNRKQVTTLYSYLLQFDCTSVVIQFGFLVFGLLTVFWKLDFGYVKAWISIWFQLYLRMNCLVRALLYGVPENELFYSVARKIKKSTGRLDSPPFLQCSVSKEVLRPRSLNFPLD